MFLHSKVFTGTGRLQIKGLKVFFLDYYLFNSKKATSLHKSVKNSSFYVDIIFSLTFKKDIFFDSEL